MPGFGNASGFELRLQDRTAASFQETARVANMLVDSLNRDPRLQGVTSGFQPNFPQYLLKVDLAQAAKLGVNVNEALESCSPMSAVSIRRTLSGSVRCTR